MKETRKWVMGGSVLVLVSLVANTAVSLRQRSHAVTEASATATRFLSDLNTHDYAGAYALLDARQQRALTVAAMQTAEEQIEKKHGKPLGRREVDEYHPNQRLTTITLSCSNIYQKESEPIRVVLTRTTDGWRVQEYRYDFSPA